MIDKGELDNSSPANIWDCAKNDLKRWITMALINQWTSHPKFGGKVEYVLATDASLYGWGAVLFIESTGEIHILGGKWDKKYGSAEINELEAKAVGLALQGFKKYIDQTAVKTFLILVDNTASMYALKKGRSKAWELNAAVLFTLEQLPKDAAVHVAYIDSNTNKELGPDLISRGRTNELNLEELPSKLGQMGRRLARMSLRVAVPRACAFHLRTKC